MTTQGTIERSPQHAPNWHTLSVDRAIERLATTLTGLQGDEAARRLDVHGPNELQTLTRESAWRTLFAQFQNALIVILLSATIISGFLGHTLEAIVITVIVLFVILIAAAIYQFTLGNSDEPRFCGPASPGAQPTTGACIEPSSSRSS